MSSRVQCYPHQTPFQAARLPGQSQTGLEYLPHLVVQDQLGAKYLQRTLGEGPVFRLNPQRHFPPEVKVSPGLRLGVADLVVGLEQQRCRQEARRHAVPAVVRAVEPGEIGVPEQPAPHRGQQAVGRAFPPHVVQVQPVRFPKSPLVRSSPSRLHLLTPSIAAYPAPRLLGQPGLASPVLQKEDRAGPSCHFQATKSGAALLLIRF